MPPRGAASNRPHDVGRKSMPTRFSPPANPVTLTVLMMVSGVALSKLTRPFPAVSLYRKAGTSLPSSCRNSNRNGRADSLMPARCRRVNRVIWYSNTNE